MSRNTTWSSGRVGSVHQEFAINNPLLRDYEHAHECTSTLSKRMSVQSKVYSRIRKDHARYFTFTQHAPILCVLPSYIYIFVYIGVEKWSKFRAHNLDTTSAKGLHLCVKCRVEESRTHNEHKAKHLKPMCFYAFGSNACLIMRTTWW